MVVSMAGFTINDAITKYASSAMNMGQVMLIRGIFATLFIGALAWHRGALKAPRAIANPMLAIRVFGEVGGTVTFLIALSHLPIATVSAVLQALPLAVTMGAALVFGEDVRWRRWLAIAVGFVGVLVIIRPGLEGFNSYTLLVLASVVFCAIRDLATKRLPDDIPTAFVSTVTAIAVTVTGAFLIVPMGGWTTPPAWSVMLLACGATLLVVGYQFIIMAMRVGDISFIAPFRYTALLFSILLGLIIFGDIPDGPMIAGALIVVGSGLYTLYREQAAGRRKPAAESTGTSMPPDGL